MPKIRPHHGFLLMALLVAVPLAAAETSEDPDTLTPRIVMFDAMPPGLTLGGSFLGREVIGMDEHLGFVVIGGSPMMASASKELRESVRGVEEDPMVQMIRMTPDDPGWGKQYGPEQVRAPDAWDMTMGTVDATICVVDTGVRYSHEDLAGSRWLGGYDFVENDDDPMDENGHGTHVAGTAAATTGNGRGIAGIAQAGIYAARVLDAKGSGSNAWVASGIRWCADAGANIITMSLGSPNPSSALGKAVEYASAKGSLLIAAAGNDGPCRDCVGYPAAYPDVMAVACTNAKKDQCEFSSAGIQVDVAAPGQDIVSTWVDSDKSYKSLSGTSMSTPHVAGLAALVRAAAPGLSAQATRDILTTTAEDLGREGRDDAFGFGLINAQAAIAAAMGKELPAPTDPAPEKPLPDEPIPDEPERDDPPRGSPGDHLKPWAFANAPRVARAGQDGNATVTLDGRNTVSFDRIASWVWEVDGKKVATGEVAEVKLGEGDHYVTLTVTTVQGASDTDGTPVTVIGS